MIFENKFSDNQFITQMEKKFFTAISTFTFRAFLTGTLFAVILRLRLTQIQTDS